MALALTNLSCRGPLFFPRDDLWPARPASIPPNEDLPKQLQRPEGSLGLLMKWTDFGRPEQVSLLPRNLYPPPGLLQHKCTTKVSLIGR